MRGLDAANSGYEEEVADIAFFNLALDAGRPDLVFADQAVEEAVVAFGDGAGIELLDTPLVLDADADVFELLVGGDVAGFVLLVGDLAAHDVEHLLLHGDHFPWLRRRLCRTFGAWLYQPVRSRPLMRETQPSAPAGGSLGPGIGPGRRGGVGASLGRGRCWS